MGPKPGSSPIGFRVHAGRRAGRDAQGATSTDDGSGTLVEQRMYQLIRQPGPIEDRFFQIEFRGPRAPRGSASRSAEAKVAAAPERAREALRAHSAKAAEWMVHVEADAPALDASEEGMLETFAST